MNINTFVVKIASRCNINCTYCYMYNLGDSSYKLQPKFIEKTTTINFVNKLLSHLQKSNTGTVFIILHGGEPLLMKKEDFEYFMDSFKILSENNIRVVFALQTNGILIDKEWIDIFRKYNINIGVSLDGSELVNDKFRIDKKGNGTYHKVIKGLEILKENNYSAGILSVMNLECDPVEYYEHFKNLSVPSLDVLLLDATHDNKETIFNNKMTPSDWYIKVFDEWFKDNNQKLQIRMFNVLIKSILGEDTGLDNLGILENKVLVLETNGDLEAVDVLKACGESFTKNEININTNEIDEVSKSTLIEVYYNSGKYLPRKCLACPVQEICGGGYLPHRYSSVNGFNNPTIYCNDLLKLITYIQNKVFDSMPLELINETGISKLTYEEALELIEKNLPNIPIPEYTSKLEHFRNLQVTT